MASREFVDDLLEEADLITRSRATTRTYALRAAFQILNL